MLRTTQKRVLPHLERREALAAGGYGMEARITWRILFEVLYGFAILAIHARKRAHVESVIGGDPTHR